MKVAESSLLGRLDEVRPTGAVNITRVGDKVPARKAVPVAPARKTVISYRTVAVSAETRFSGIGKWVFFFLAVVVPTVLGGVYYTYFASPQYVSEFRFSVRPNMGAGRLLQLTPHWRCRTAILSRITSTAATLLSPLKRRLICDRFMLRKALTFSAG